MEKKVFDSEWGKICNYVKRKITEDNQNDEITLYGQAKHIDENVAFSHTVIFEPGIFRKTLYLYTKAVLNKERSGFLKSFLEEVEELHKQKLVKQDKLERLKKSLTKEHVGTNEKEALHWELQGCYEFFEEIREGKLKPRNDILIDNTVTAEKVLHKLEISHPVVRLNQYVSENKEVYGDFGKYLIDACKEVLYGEDKIWKEMEVLLLSEGKNNTKKALLYFAQLMDMVFDPNNHVHRENIYQAAIAKLEK